MGFNSTFKGLISPLDITVKLVHMYACHLSSTKDDSVFSALYFILEFSSLKMAILSRWNMSEDKSCVCYLVQLFCNKYAYNVH